MVKIENHTERVISLPITDSHPEGKKLVPGENDVPDLYWSELMSYTSTPAADSQGRPRPVRYPGREVIQSLKEPVKISLIGGSRHGPQITVYEQPGQAPDEPAPLPNDLRDMAEDVALAVIAATQNRGKLAEWSKDSRKKVSAAAKAQLEAIKP